MELPNDTASIVSSTSQRSCLDKSAGDNGSTGRNDIVSDNVEDWKPVRSKKNKSRAKTHENLINTTNSAAAATTATNNSKTLDRIANSKEEPVDDTSKSNCSLDEYDQISDQDLRKVMLITQCMKKSTGQDLHDRTGEWTTRVKFTQEMASIIEDGLYQYLQQLLQNNDCDLTNKQHKTLGYITQEDFNNYTGSPKKDSTYLIPPPPPPPPYAEAKNLDETSRSGGKFFLFQL